MARSILDLAYPVKCPSCGKPLTDADGPHACRKCVSAIRPNPRPPESDPKQFSFSVAYSACMYDGPMKELIHAFKYRRKSGADNNLFNELNLDSNELHQQIF